MFEFRRVSRDLVQMMFTSYLSVENLMPHFREELSAESYNLNAFLVLWGGGYSFAYNFRYIVNSIFHIFSSCIQALGRKLNEYWDAKMGHSNEVQIQ